MSTVKPPCLVRGSTLLLYRNQQQQQKQRKQLRVHNEQPLRVHTLEDIAKEMLNHCQGRRHRTDFVFTLPVVVVTVTVYCAVTITFIVFTRLFLAVVCMTRAAASCVPRRRPCRILEQRETPKRQIQFVFDSRASFLSRSQYLYHREDSFDDDSYPSVTVKRHGSSDEESDKSGSSSASKLGKLRLTDRSLSERTVTTEYTGTSRTSYKKVEIPPRSKLSRRHRLLKQTMRVISRLYHRRRRKET